MPAVSIIVPVYKAEAYLHRCVDSILAQTFTNFEVLLIDDGSPDNSGKYCDEYALLDSRVRVFHKENGGVSAARQLGLEYTQGEYVIHADPDDWVESDWLECLYTQAEEVEADMVFCDFFIETESGQKYNSQKPVTLTAQGVLNALLNQELHGACWNKLVRRKCFNKYNVRFPEHVICWEDLWVFCDLLLHITKISYIPKALYHYDFYTNVDSIVRKVTRKSVESQISFCKHFGKFIIEGKITKESMQKSISGTKELMFYSKLYTGDQIIRFFKEINSQYINEHSKFQIKNPLPYCLALTLKGHYKLGRCIFHSYTSFILPFLIRVKRIIS